MRTITIDQRMIEFLFLLSGSLFPCSGSFSLIELSSNNGTLVLP
ncbi:MAG: hypothetical protein RR250_03190 [Akkermansia sp.]